MKKRFRDYANEYLKFDRVENKRSQRADVHAFMLLDELFPGNQDLIGAAWNDEILLDISDEQIESLTEDQIIELRRCGVRWRGDSDSLSMFV